MLPLPPTSKVFSSIGLRVAPALEAASIGLRKFHAAAANADCLVSQSGWPLARFASCSFSFFVTSASPVLTRTCSAAWVSDGSGMFGSSQLLKIANNL